MADNFRLDGEFFNKDATKAYPKETAKFMKAQAQKLAKATKAAAKSAVHKRTGNLFKGIKAGKKVYEYSDADYNVRVYYGKPAYHGHLIEYGHDMKSHKGDTVGTVQGYEIMAKAHKQNESKFYADVENDLLDFIIKELEK